MTDPEGDHSSPQPATTIHELFAGGIEEEADPFAALGSGEEAPLERSETPLETTVGVEELQENGEGPVKAEYAHQQGDGERAREVQGESSDGPVGPATHGVEGDGKAKEEPQEHGQTQHQAILDHKDFSALLEEFEELDVPAHEVNIPSSLELGQSTDEADPFDALAESHSPQPITDIEQPPGSSLRDTPNLAALLSDDLGASVFDELVTQDSSPPIGQESDSPVPDLSIENSRVEPDSDVGGGGAGDVSMFSNASDWLADTTVDESFDIDQTQGQQSTPPLRANSLGTGEDGGDQVIPYEIPQGWFDDEGGWHWYTEEEKEQVRLTMLSSADPGGSQNIGQDDSQAPTSFFQNSPALSSGQSENAARRTPQPEQVGRMADTSYDLYAPPAPSYQPPLSSSVTSYGSYAAPAAPSAQPPSYPSSYAPASQSSAYAPARAYDPYAASTSGQTYTPSYGGPATSTVPPIKRGPAQPERPAQPQRVASNAYDPPFLRPQKSFIRAPSAMSTTPAFTGIQSSMSPPPLPTPAPPPPGPPRRSKTPAAGPSFAERPRQGSVTSTHSIAQDYVSSPPSTSDAYAVSNDSYPAPPQPTSQSSTSAKAYQPPPRNQSYNSFDPPLRPSSAVRNRPPPSQPAMAPPALAISPPPTSTNTGPPRGPSRGSVRSKSPMFEHKPEFAPRPASRLGSILPAGPSATLSPQQRSDEHPHWTTQQEDYHGQRSAQHTSEGSADQEEPSHGGEDDHTYGETRDHPPPDSASQPSWMVEEPPYSPPRDHHTHTESRNHESDQPLVQSSHDDSSMDPSPNGVTPRAADPSDKSTHAYGLGFHPTGSPPQAQPVPISYDPYAPSSTDHRSAGQSDPYAQHQGSHQSRESESYQPISSYAPSLQSTLLNPIDSYAAPLLSPSYGSDLGISPPQPSYFQAMSSVTDENYIPQQVLEQRPVSEDPLGRCTLSARNTPLAVFGFGGVLVTGFPALADAEASAGPTHSRTPSYGYASGRGQLWIRSVSELASTSALKDNDNVFPGPLVLDPSTPKGAVGDKKKREAIMSYLEARAKEIENGLPYLKSSASQARREEEGKLVLVRLLSAMVAGDGKFAGNEKVDDAVRLALGDAASVVPTAAPTSPIKAKSIYASTLQSSAPVKATPPQLNELSRLLISGNKADAAQYAANAGLWSHALVISSSVNQELWSEIVLRFTEAELEGQSSAALKASYAIFSGKTVTSVDELVAAADLDGDQSQDKWREVIAAVVFNGKPADLACLDELGARFRKSSLNYPSHVCYLLSPTSPFIDITQAAYDRTISLTQNVRDDDAIVFAEIAEYGRSLVAVPKGQELPFPGLPQLLPYKLQRAWLAAELGDVDQAKRYCAAIEAASKAGRSGPSVLPPPLAASLEDLNERLTGTPSANPARLIGGRKSKAGLGSWIEGRLTKFIAGEEDGSAPPKPVAIAKEKDVAGPFSHFSTISPAASGPISRNASTADLRNGALGDSQRTSPMMQQRQWGQPDYGAESAGSSTYGGEGHSAASTLTPHAEVQDGDEGEFINPMASLSLGPRGVGPSDYAPPAKNAVQLNEDDDDDLGFGNTSLSRGRTPKPPAEGSGQQGPDTDGKTTPSGPKEQAAPEPPKEGQQKGSWLGKWWGKKEGEGGSGPVRAKLGEESSMVFDPELKRWVVKGAKGEASAPAAPPPPPRAQTASPSRAVRQDPASRAMSATPPPSQLSRNGPAPPPASRSTTAPMGMAFTQMPDGGIKRMKSSLNESVTADNGSVPPSAPPAGPPGPPGPSGPPPPGGLSRPPSRPATGGSIDDLLSRPPSKRPASAAKKPMRNRYVDVFQPGAET